MTYASQLASIDRTPQDLLVLGVRSCQNHYATLVQQELTRTEEFDHADWAKTAASVVADNAEAPDGTQTADTVTFSAAGNLAQTTAAIVTSKAFTGSIWLRVASSTQAGSLNLFNVGFTETISLPITVTTTWQRFSVHKLFTATPVDALRFSVIIGAASDVEFWGANVTENPGARNRVILWPYVKRSNEAIGTVAVNASRCQAADAGDGSRCYYSRPSCQDPDGFNAGHDYEATAELQGFREYRFCRLDAPLAITGETVLPLIDKFDIAGQEIKPQTGVTINERLTFTFHDDAGPGVWNVPHQSRGALVNTATGAGTFWRRFLAIYRNYANPKGYLLHKVGFVEAGVTESDYQQRGKYLLQNILIRGDDRVEIECADRLKIARKNIPAKITDQNMTREITSAAATTLKVDDASEVSEPAFNATGASPDYQIVIEVNYDQSGKEEKMTVTARDLENNTLTVTRGRWGTTAKVHKDNSKFREVAEFGTERTDPTGVVMGKNPLDIVRELYRFAGISDDDIDNTTFDGERDDWLSSSVTPADGSETGFLFRRTLVKQKKVEDLIKEIRELCALMVWVDENQTVTCKLFAPPFPTDTVTEITDDGNLVEGTLEIDDADENRLTRAVVAWDLDPSEDGDIPEDFNEIHVFIALDEEESPYYGEQRAKVILSEWLRSTDAAIASEIVNRLVNRFRFGARMFRFSLEQKDDAVLVGDTLDLQTDKLQTFTGATDSRFIIVTKKKRGRRMGQIDLDAVEQPSAKTAFWAPDGLPDFDSASKADKRYGYWADDQGLVGDPPEVGYHYW